jgi:two-component system response regulator FixJ
MSILGSVQRVTDVPHVHKKPCVYLIDEDAGARERVLTALSEDAYDTRVFTSAEEFWGQWESNSNSPRCLITESRLRGLDGISLQQQLTAHRMRLPVIFVLGQADVATAVKAMKLGALDVFEKPCDQIKLRQTVRTAIELDRKQCEVESRRQELDMRLRKLTAREREVFDLLVSANSTKEIASRLGINAKTVFVHRARVLEKMQADGLVELSLMVSRASSTFGAN